ncbi:hypothetical protein PoB_001522500 [Plakobranchus ocellatus]|uniref:Uncharacterized protein n=1 Tax=Plakobranchus ocellatus TaxID=259542 RepID=A0AAV3Z254_9GAST|nr:hypothetical protein PoB_001522500 [Plakobranchus ocellatus]
MDNGGPVESRKSRRQTLGQDRKGWIDNRDTLGVGVYDCVCGKGKPISPSLAKALRRGERRSVLQWFFVCIASLQQGDLRFSGPPSGQGADGGARTHDRRVPADLRADSMATVPPTPYQYCNSLLTTEIINCHKLFAAPRGWRFYHFSIITTDWNSKPKLCRPQQGDLRLSGALSDQGVDKGTRIRDRKGSPADYRAGSLASAPPM